MVFSTHSSGLALRNSLGTFRHKQDSKLDIQIVQYVVVVVFNGQKLTTICRFSVLQVHLRSSAIPCGFSFNLVYILFSLKVPAGINSAESQNYS